MIADVIVIGGGISGTAAAFNLAREGHRVTLIERFDLAAMASGWTLAGVRQSGRDPAELPLARAAVERWALLDQQLGASTGYRRSGNLRLALAEDEVETIHALVADQAHAGLDIDFLTKRDEIRSIAPALAIERVHAAAWCPSDGSADPIASVCAFAAAAQRHGAEIRTHERVEALLFRNGRVNGVRTARGELGAARVVLAGGVLANELLRPLGVNIPLRFPMVTVVRSKPLPPVLGPVLGTARAVLAARQENDGCLRVTSGMQDWHGNLIEGPPPRVPPSGAGLHFVLEQVGAVLPALREALISECWAGVLDLTPDGLPVLDHVPGIEGLVLAGGFSGHGFGLGPITGELVTDLALEREPRLDLSAFRFDRFNSEALCAPETDLPLHG